MKPLIILLAEDNRGDVLLAQRAFRNLKVPHILQVVEHGDAAVDYLAGTGSYADRDRYPLPDLLLLDLNMPCRSGFEVMDWLNQSLIQVPVVILTTCHSQSEIDHAYQLGAKAYGFKPLTFNTLLQILKSINLDGSIAALPDTAP